MHIRSKILFYSWQAPHLTQKSSTHLRSLWTRAGRARGTPHSTVSTHSGTLVTPGELWHIPTRAGQHRGHDYRIIDNKLLVTFYPGHDGLLPGQSVSGPVDPGLARAAPGHRGLV